MAVKIAYLDHTAALGGAEISLASLLGALDRDRWEPVVILGGEGPLAGRVGSLGVKCEVIGFPSATVRPGAPAAARLLAPSSLAGGGPLVIRLSRRLRSMRAALLHTNSLRACVAGGLAARLAGVPCVWHLHSVVAPPVIPASTARLLRAMARWVPTHVICNSETTAASIGLGPSRATVIPSGVDPGPFLGLDGHRHQNPRVGLVARLAPLKGQDVFIEASRLVAEEHPEAEFILAGASMFGEDDYVRGLHAQAESAAPAKIRFSGFVEDVPGLMGSLDIVVHASVRPDGFGLSLVEAMLAGRPVVATALAGALEIVDDGVTGLLVPPGDADGMARAINFLLENPARASEIARRARQSALDRFQLNRMVTMVSDVYDQVLAA
jgi:glycosyltransferase involved in cell wall biosynthesis